MLTRLIAAICTRPPTPHLPGRRPIAPPVAAAGADPPPGQRAEDPAKRMRALAASCTDGLAALAYAQFADLLDPRAMRSRQGSEPAARSR